MDVVLTELLDRADRVVTGLAGVDWTRVLRDDVAGVAVRLQRTLDGLRVQHARVLGEAERVSAHAGTGARDVAGWIADATGTSYADVAGKVVLADAMERSPELAAAVRSGALSAASAEAVAPVINHSPTGADVAPLVDEVKGTNPREARKTAEAWRLAHRDESLEEASERRYRSRSVRSTFPVDGLVHTQVTLPAREHAQFVRSIDHAAGPHHDGDERTRQQRLADGLIALCGAHAAGQVTGGRERPTLLVVTDLATIQGDNDEPGTTDDGHPIPADIIRRLAEHATLQRVYTTGSTVLDVGRGVRFASDTQYKALVVRDAGCRWPGCTIPAAWCEIDHLTPYQPGNTRLDNLWLLCTHHHHQKHQPGVTTTGTTTNATIHLPNGTTLHSTLDTRQRRPQAAA